jgi:hypothetical protein
MSGEWVPPHPHHTHTTPTPTQPHPPTHPPMSRHTMGVDVGWGGWVCVGGWVGGWMGAVGCEYGGGYRGWLDYGGWLCG